MRYILTSAPGCILYNKQLLLLFVCVTIEETETCAAFQNFRIFKIIFLVLFYFYTIYMLQS